MPSDTQSPSKSAHGRCYCGACVVRSTRHPQHVAYCHCSDCRRWTGAPVAAFAAFETPDAIFSPPLDAGRSFAPGVRRWTCSECGSPLAATFDYLPGQIYVPLGLLDNAQEFPPALHCHADSALPWLHQSDGLERTSASARLTLRSTKAP